MKSLSPHEIEELLEETETRKKLKLHDEEILNTHNIDGCGLTGKRSDIIDEGFLKVVGAMEVPPEVFLVATGASGRREATPGSDFDSYAYVPDHSFEESFAAPYRESIRTFLGKLGLEGEPMVCVPGDFTMEESDLVTIASTNLDMRPLFYGGTGLTQAAVQEKVRAVCDPFFIASRHELILQRKFGYMALGTQRTEHHVDFDIKEDRGGLRHLQHALWLIAAIENTNLKSMYGVIQKEDPEVYGALDLLLHIRSWLHLKKRLIKSRNIDLLDGNLWQELKGQFGADIIEKISIARTDIMRYEKTRILREKQKGMVIGDGTKYGILGLEIEHESWQSKSDLVIQLLLNAQKTGLQISPLEFNNLEHQTPKCMIGPNQKYAFLIREGGKFSTTMRRLMRLGLAQEVFPSFDKLKNEIYPPKHRHAHLTRIGRVIERLENLEIVVGKVVKDQYSHLTLDQQAGIKIALVSKDIPKLAEMSSEDYFRGLRELYPELQRAVETAQHLVKKHRILFDCALSDDWNDERELKRIAREIGTPADLDAVLVYTCAMLDYGKTEYYQKYPWDKTFSLYYALKEFMEGNDADKRKKFADIKMRLSPEQAEIFEVAPPTFLRSRYVLASEDMTKTMKFLDRVRRTGEPQITITTTPEDNLRILLSSEFHGDIPAIVAGTCLENDISINDAEIHTFSIEKPLTVLFLEADFSMSGLTPLGKNATIRKLEHDLQVNIEKRILSEKDHKAILEKSGASYLLERTKKTENYKLIVTAEKNVPGFLYALTKLIADSGVHILSTTVYTHPHDHGKSQQIEDIFILAPQNIEELRERISPSEMS